MRNLCTAIRTPRGHGVMPDGTSRFSCDGREVVHSMVQRDNYGVRRGLLRIRINRDRRTPRGGAPPTPPGIRITYHGGSTGLGLDRDIETGETERLEVVVAQGLLDRWVS